MKILEWQKRMVDCFTQGFHVLPQSFYPNGFNPKFSPRRFLIQGFTPTVLNPKVFTPKGWRPKAQGCRFGYPGNSARNDLQPQRGCVPWLIFNKCMLISHGGVAV